MDDLRRKLSKNLNELKSLITEIEYDTDIDIVTNKFISILQDCSLTVFGQTKESGMKTPIVQNNKKKAWFNADCYVTRKQLLKPEICLTGILNRTLF